MQYVSLQLNNKLRLLLTELYIANAEHNTIIYSAKFLETATSVPVHIIAWAFNPTKAVNPLLQMFT
jgi:hypothetical protein